MFTAVFALGCFIASSQHTKETKRRFFDKLLIERSHELGDQEADLLDEEQLRRVLRMKEWSMLSWSCPGACPCGWRCWLRAVRLIRLRSAILLVTSLSVSSSGKKIPNGSPSLLRVRFRDC